MTALKSANDLDLNGHKVINLATPGAGSNDAARKIDLENASVADRDRANHSGSQLASTISNFDSQVRTSRLDQMSAPTAPLSVNSQKIENLATGTAANDGVNKAQLDAAIAALASGQTLKGTVRVAATSNVNLAAPGTTVDGVTMANGEIFLATGQTTGSQNGPYVWNGAAVAATRATNWDVAGEAVVGSYWVVAEGTNADKFALLTNDTFTLGTTTGAFNFIGVASSSDNDTSYAANVGTGSAGPYAVTHNLNSTDVTVHVKEVSSGYAKLVNWKSTDANTVSLEPDETWASNSHRCIVIKVL